VKVLPFWWRHYKHPFNPAPPDSCDRNGRSRFDRERLSRQAKATSAGFEIQYSRVLKNKHQAVSQGLRRFGKRSILIDM
jgi:hypothetical protein